MGNQVEELNISKPQVLKRLLGGRSNRLPLAREQIVLAERLAWSSQMMLVLLKTPLSTSL